MGEYEPWVPPLAGSAENVVGALAGAAGQAAAPLARAALRAGMYEFFRGRDGSAVPPTSAAGDVGWFGPDSVTWRVHGDASMFVGGLTALAFQALHPLAMAGVSDHSDFRVDPLGRVRRTAAFVGVTAYGTTAEATAACAAIRNVHSRVSGYAPDGRAYSAADPHLLGWVHVAEFAGFAAANRRFGAEPMSRVELDRYVDEVARIGAELGVEDPPRSWAALDAQLARYRPELAVTEQTREAWKFLRAGYTVLPGGARPAYELLFIGALACLPAWVRQLWGIRMPSTLELLACRALVRALDGLMGEPPRLTEAKARAAAATASP